MDVNNKENEFTETNYLDLENNENPASSSIYDAVEKQYSEDYIELEKDALTDFQGKEGLIKQLSEKDRDIYTKARLGQGKFRAELIKHWQTCSVTNFKNRSLLIASHIKPWRNCTVEEAIDKWNGLLLTPNLDKLFDKGFITFNNDGNIKFSSHLSPEEAKQLGVTQNMRLRNISAQHQLYFEYHRNNVFQKDT